MSWYVALCTLIRSIMLRMLARFFAKEGIAGSGIAGFAAYFPS